MQPAFVNERNLTQRAAQPFQRALRTPEAGAHRGNVKVPGERERRLACRPPPNPNLSGLAANAPSPSLPSQARNRASRTRSDTQVWLLIAYLCRPAVLSVVSKAFDPRPDSAAVRPSTSSYSFGSGFGRPRPTLHLTSSLDHFAMASTASSLSSTSSSGGQRSSPLSPASRPSMSNYSNTVGMSKWTTTPGNRSFYPFPMGRHTFGVVNR